MLNKIITAYLEVTALVNQAALNGNYTDSWAALSSAKDSIYIALKKDERCITIYDHVNENNPYEIRAISFITDDFYRYYTYERDREYFRLESEVNEGR